MRKLLYALLLCAMTSNLMAVQLSVSSLPSQCFQPDGSIFVGISNGTSPYIVSLEGAQPVQIFGSTWTFVDLLSGTYAVQVTDATGAVASASIIVEQIGITISGMIIDRHDCDASCSGVGRLLPAEFGGIEPYTYSNPIGVDAFFTEHVRVLGLCWPLDTVTVTDANGCTGSVIFNVSNNQAIPLPASDVVPECGVEVNGSFNLVWPNPQQASFRLEGPGVDTIFYNLPQPFLFDSLEAGVYATTIWATDDIRFCDDPAGCQRYCTAQTIVTIPQEEEPCGLSTGIGTDEDPAPIRVFPQPATDVLHVIGVDPNTPMALFGLDGRSIEVGRAITANGVSVDIDHLVPGPYYIRLPDRTIGFIKE